MTTKAEDTTVSIGEIWHTVVEQPMIAVGLMDRPALRFVVFTVGTAVLLHALKPAKTESAETTLFPGIGGIRKDWAIVSLLVGTFSVLFI